MAAPDLTFSIVINTLNRCDVLDEAIRGVFALDYPAFELIVVNGPSTDATEAVLARWDGRIKRRDCTFANLSRSRNIGIAAAAGDVVAFLDDDAVPHPQWLSRLAAHYAQAGVGGVGGFTVDHTGVRWQVRKTMCDRFGSPYAVDDFFDERPFNFPGTPFYPSLLGTNSSFRRSALLDIGGFDHAYAYMLDETDVCLRLVDAGWSIHYEPDALVFHQFAPSGLRNVARKPRSTYAASVSKTYFATRHGRSESQHRLADALTSFRDGELAYYARLHAEGAISREHHLALELDLQKGLADGLDLANAALAANKNVGDLEAEDGVASFLPCITGQPLRLVMVSQGLPPHNDMGIARWTRLAADGLTAEGVQVHIITRAVGEPTRSFRDGVWIHSIAPDDAGATSIERQYSVPAAHAAWMAAVKAEVDFIKTFGVDVVSFPIWDLEGLPLLDDATLPAVMSLHTSYLLARPFNPQWNERPVFGSAVIDRIIAAEKSALVKATTLLANSHAIVTEIEAAYAVSIAAKSVIVPHGTPDTLADAGMTLAEKFARARERGGLQVLVPARFELRKGYDLSLRLADALRDDDSITFHFTGTEIDDAVRARALAECGVDIASLPNAIFHGVVDRADLDRHYLAADVVVVVSRFESFGLVAIEAMAAGAAVLALSAGALPEVVEQDTSGWVLAEDEAFIENASGALLSASRDAALRERLALGAYDAYARRFTVAEMARGLRAAYRSSMIGRELGE
jgi:hypothetical protein